MKFFALLLLFLLALLPGTGRSADAPTRILNVSYDVTREFYQDYNAAFQRHWQTEHPEAKLEIEQSHAGSSKQARAVIDGLPADVVTMNQDTDIQLLADAGLVAPDWRTRLPDHAAPSTTTIVFLVRKGNPKGIRDWPDLLKPGVEPIIPNPKTSGNGRYSYLAAWAYAQTRPGGSPEKARAFVGDLFRRVTVLPSGGRDATNTFVQRGIGDVLLTFESETLQITRVFSPDAYDVVTPSASILAAAPVSVVDKVVDQRGTRALATAYLTHLWSDEGQKIAARHYFRPRSAAILAENAALFPPLELLTIDAVFGGWANAQKHFSAGGEFDAIFARR